MVYWPLFLTDFALYTGGGGFDYDTQNQYDLGISCTDGYLTASEYFYVYLVKNSAPTFLNLQSEYCCFILLGKDFLPPLHEDARLY